MSINVPPNGQKEALGVVKPENPYLSDAFFRVSECR